MGANPPETVEQRGAAQRRWREANPDRVKAYNEKWKAARAAYNNSPRGKARQQRYYATPLGKAGMIRRRAARRARKLAATVPLTTAEHQRIVALYAEAARRTAETGVAHHVDHDVPLALGGLHHPDNLHVVPAALNLAKGARYGSTLEFILS